jgi:KaiC/GvpD/RAD55 family RecA-like ATPase
MPFAFILPPTLHDRLAFGVAGLDRMMEGGIPRGEACLIAGASGTGKTVLSQHFIAEGVRQGEPTVAMIFEENPEEYATKAARFGWDFHAWEREGKMALIYGRPYGLTLDEVADRLRGAAARLGAKRVVIDSISGMDMARSPADNSDFREVLLHLVAEFKAHRITLVATTEISELFGELRLTSERVSPIADNVILLRHVEIQSELLEVIGVIKMRGSGHDRDLRHFRITSRGARVGPPFHEYTGLLSGVPTMVAVMGPQPFAPGLEAHQSTLVQAIFGLGTATEEEMIAETGYPKEEVERLVRELVNTGYLVRETVDDRTVYHVSMVTWAPSVRQAPRGTVRRGGGPRRDER